MFKNIINYLLITFSVLIFISADSTTDASMVNNIQTASDTVTNASKKVEVKKDEVIEINDEKFNTRNQYKSNTMILFEDEYEPDYRNYEEEKKNENIQFKPVVDERYNLIAPKTIDEFYKSGPVYSFDINKVIISGTPIIDKNLGEKLFEIAYEMFSSNNLKNSRIIFEKLVFYNYRIAESYNYISWCYFLYRDYDNAINYMKKAKLQGDKDNLDSKILSDYAYQIGRIYLILNDYKNAVENFQEAINYNNNSLKVYNSLGISYYKQGDTQNALESWKKGMDIGDVICKKNYQWLLQQGK